jgi:dolichol-phosphate mannosyltransferase
MYSIAHSIDLELQLSQDHLMSPESPLFQPISPLAPAETGDSFASDFAALGRPAEWELPAATVEPLGPKSSEYCVLIPVLNEGTRIKELLREMRRLPDRPDVIICDGGSVDGCTATELMRELGVRCVIRKTGPGKMSSQLRLLFAYALLEDYRGMVHMDGNNKDDPACIAEFVAHLRDGYDCVAGSRFRRGGKSINTPRHRAWAIRLIHAPLISLAAHRRFSDTTNSYRGYSGRFIRDPRVIPFRDVFVAYNLPYYLLVRASRLNFRVTEIPVTRRYPKGEVPTKISAIRGNLGILREVFETLVGAYNPRQAAASQAGALP